MKLVINICSSDGELLERESLVVENSEEVLTHGHLLPVHDAIHQAFRCLFARAEEEEEEPKVICERCGREVLSSQAVICREHGFDATICKTCDQAMFLELEED